MSTTQGIKLDDNTTQRLKTLAAQRQRTAHWLMRDAIDTYLDREEQYEQEKQEDADRWERYLLTGKAITNAEASAHFDSLIASKSSI